MECFDIDSITLAYSWVVLIPVIVLHQSHLLLLHLYLFCPIFYTMPPFVSVNTNHKTSSLINGECYYHYDEALIGFPCNRFHTTRMGTDSNINIQSHRIPIINNGIGTLDQQNLLCIMIVHYSILIKQIQEYVLYVVYVLTMVSRLVIIVVKQRNVFVFFEKVAKQKAGHAYQHELK